MGDLKSQLTKGIPTPKPFEGTFDSASTIRKMKAIVAGYPMKIWFEDKKHKDGG